MKQKFTLITLSLLMIAFNGYAQFTNGLVGKFGIDGDLQSNARLQGSWTASGSWDWFKSGTGTGSGVIDTTGASVIRTQLAAGQNLNFTKNMNATKFSVRDNVLMMDAKYMRDYFGNSMGNDKTIFTLGAKNGDVPTGWGTNPTGASLQDKVDIIDAYTYMWRDGTNVMGPTPSNMFLAIGASTIGTSGNRYIDFEMYVSPISYNTSTGVFSNSGPATTGGHTIWEFNADGSLKKIGDLDVSFSFTSTTVDTIAMYIWVPRTTFNTVVPTMFRFVPNEFYGANNTSAYGYAKIVPRPGFTMPAWGAVNTLSVIGPAWGTASKDIGAVGSAYFSNSHSVGQFAETAINLTGMGIDPAIFGSGADICSPIFRRVLIKSRASASFSSALADFTNPMDFIDASMVPANIVPPQTLTCTRTSIQLKPATINAVLYNWTTPNGNIVGRTDTSVITVNAPGKYYLNASYMAGCPWNKDSVIVNKDVLQPVATATTFGSLNPNDPASTVTVVGGDVAASSVVTPYGGSAGLAWKWTGPVGYPGATTKDIVTGIAGNYTLVLTELRNGCKDTAVTTVFSFIILPLQIIEFSASKQPHEKVAIQCRYNDHNTPGTLELMRSYDGRNFERITRFSTNGRQETQVLTYHDQVQDRRSDLIYYKMKVYQADGRTTYSDIARVNFSQGNNEIIISPNPMRDKASVQLNSPADEMAEMTITDMSGKNLQVKKMLLKKGSNTIPLTDMGRMPAGRYTLAIKSASQSFTSPIIKL